MSVTVKCSIWTLVKTMLTTQIRTEVTTHNKSINTMILRGSEVGLLRPRTIMKTVLNAESSIKESIFKNLENEPLILTVPRSQRIYP